MGAEELTATSEQPVKRIHMRVAWLCGVVLFLEGYDISAAGNAIPSLVDAWKLRPAMFTQALTAGNAGLLFGSLSVGWLGDRLRRKPLLIGCVLEFGIFSLLSALAHSPMQLAAVRFLTGLGLGGGIPLAIAIATDFAPQISQGRFVMLTNAGIPIGLALGGLMASQLVHFFSWRAIFVAGGVSLALIKNSLPLGTGLSTSLIWTTSGDRSCRRWLLSCVHPRGAGLLLPLLSVHPDD
jgi:AAHS family 4-hydroxybenzoate transporter-like MFS transporter